MRTSVRRRVTIALLLAFVLLAGCRGTRHVMSDTQIVENDKESATARSESTFSTTPSGLKYRILQESDGPRPKPSDQVSIHYRGWLDDGTQFDNSRLRDEPETFQLSEMIPGWTEGLQLIGEGGRIELEVPADLGFGQHGSPPDIPPNATLHYEMELVEVVVDE